MPSTKPSTSRSPSPSGETELEKMRAMLKLIGFDYGWRMVSGFDPYDELLRTQQVAFEMEVGGERVVCVKRYTDGDLWAARDPGAFLASTETIESGRIA